MSVETGKSVFGKPDMANNVDSVQKGITRKESLA